MKNKVEMVWTCAKADKDETKGKILQMTVDGKRNRGRPN